MNLHSDAIITALSPLSHNGDSFGTEAQFNRMGHVMSDGKTTEMIPVVTGNSLRGALRNAAAEYILESLGIQTISQERFYLLFCGGTLGKSAGRGGRSNLDQLRKAIATLNLLGGSQDNEIAPGRLTVKFIRPMVREIAHLLPEAVRSRCTKSAFEIMESVSYSRLDDARATVHADRIDPVTAAPATLQMRYEIESMKAGTELYWGFQIHHASDLDVLAFVSALTKWAECPVLGGRSAIGHGEVQIAFSTTWGMPDGQTWFIAPDQCRLPDLTAYNDYLRTNADQIRAMLTEA